MIHQQDQTAAASGLPTPGRLLRTVGPILLLAVVVVTVLQGSISWASVATVVMATAVAIGSLLWFRAAAAAPPRPPSSATTRPRLPTTPLPVASAVPVLAVVLVGIGSLIGPDGGADPRGWWGWAVVTLVLVLEWCAYSLLLSALARVATWIVLAATGRWPRRSNRDAVAP